MLMCPVQTILTPLVFRDRVPGVVSRSGAPSKARYRLPSAKPRIGFVRKTNGAVMQTNSFPRRGLFWLAFVLALVGWQTAQAEVKIESTLAFPSAVASVGDRPGDPGVSDTDPDDPGFDTSWRTGYNKSLSAHVDHGGASASATGDLNAKVEVNGDQLKYTASVSGKGMSTSNAGGSVIAELQVGFSVTQRSTFSLTGSVSASGASGADLDFNGNGTRFGRLQIRLQSNDPLQTLPISKSGTIEPGQYSIILDVDTSSSGSESSVAGELILRVGTASDFHWINPNGGDFGTASNWNPAGVPGTAADVAIFDLVGPTTVNIQTNNDTVGFWIINGMKLNLQGSASVVGVDTSRFLSNFEVSGEGFLGLVNGATFSTISSDIGALAAAQGFSSVLVTGPGTRWTNSNQVLIGDDGPGFVTVADGGVLENLDEIEVGFFTGTGGLIISSGGSVQTVDCVVFKGTVLVTGEGASSSKFDIASTLSLGGLNDPLRDASPTGPVVVQIDNGGTVRAQGVFLGDRDGIAVDTLTISGVGTSGQPSSLISAGPNARLSVEGAAGTQLEVKDGALLSTSNQVAIGNGLRVGKVLVHGETGIQPSTWAETGDVFIHSKVVPSELVVQERGRVTISGQLQMGTNAGEVSRVIVSGADSSLSAATVFVGMDGDGDLRISDGGRIETTQALVGSDRSSGGTGLGLVTIEGTPLSSSEWHTVDCEVGVIEPGTVRLLGTTIGPFSVGGATLAVDGTLTVDTKGSVVGNGTLTAGNRVLNGGLISPGLSPGVIVIQGNYEQTSDGVLKMEAAGLNAGQFDVLHVTGTSTLGGTMEVTFLDGYLPKAGDVLPFVQIDGAVSGDFAHIIFPQLAPGFQIKTEVVNGKYQLTALNDGVRLFVKEMFRGLLASDPASHHDAGFFTIHTTARAGFSARFVLGGRSFALSGKFDSAGKFSKAIPRQGAAPLTVNLELALVNGARVITGAIVDGDRSIPISADQAKAFNAKTNPAPQAGKYTALLQFDSAASDTPQANGIGVVGISTSGAIRFVGALADGTRLSQGTVLSKSGEWPLYVLLYKKQGSLFGELQFREKAGSDFDGTLQWSRPPTPNDKIQTAGFFATLPTIGSKYIAAPPRPAVLDLPNGGTAMLSDADLTLTKSLMLSPPNKFIVLDPGADKFSLSATANGLLSGRFIHPKTGSSTTVHGVIFQKENFGSGFFVRPGMIGSFGLQANP